MLTICLLLLTLLPAYALLRTYTPVYTIRAWRAARAHVWVREVEYPTYYYWTQEAPRYYPE